MNVNEENGHAVDSTCTECPEGKSLHNERKEISGQWGLWGEWTHDGWLDQGNENPDYVQAVLKTA